MRPSLREHGWRRNEKQVPPLRRRVRSGSGRNDKGFYATVAVGPMLLWWLDPHLHAGRTNASVAT
jgi:hypothetical protein